MRAKRIFASALGAVLLSVGLGVVNSGTALAAGCTGADTVSPAGATQHIYHPLTGAPIVGVTVITIGTTTHTWVCLGSNPTDTGAGVAVFDLDPSRVGKEVRVGTCVFGACGVPLEYTGAELGSTVVPAGVTVVPAGGPLCVNTTCPMVVITTASGATVVTVYIDGTPTNINIP